MTNVIFEKFKYIHAPEYPHNPNDVLETKYKNIEDLHGRFVSRRENKITPDDHSGYYVFLTRDDFIKYLSTLQSDKKLFHEVIFNQKQKLKFDIDAPIDVIKNFNILCDSTENSDIDPSIQALINELSDAYKEDNDLEVKFKKIIDNIVHTLRDTFFITYGRELPTDSIIVCESKNSKKTENIKNTKKFSSHIVVNNFYVNGPEQANEFARRLISYMPQNYKKIIDAGIYKRIQNFRIVGCHKGDMRIKQITSAIVDVGETLITNISKCIELPDIAAKKLDSNKFQHDNLHSDDIEKVLKICELAGILTNHQFKFVRAGQFVFSRTKPDINSCEFCHRKHESDNTLLINVKIQDGIIKVFQLCRRFLEEHKNKTVNFSKLIGEYTSDNTCVDATITPDNISNLPQKVVNWIDRKITSGIRELSHGGLYSTQTNFDNLPNVNKHIYSEPTLRDFELTKTLIVHAAMKMGKTKKMMDYLAKHFTNNLKSPIIRFISFRQTFSGNLKEKFLDFTLYSDVKGPLIQNRLIVQVESLHRLHIADGSEPPDLLILDECESIFEQFDSGLLRGNFNECFAKFQYLLKYSTHVICMDANISDRTFRLLALMRPEFLTNVIYHHNTRQNATDDMYFLTGCKAKWLGMLYAALDADERIVIPISSLKEAEVIERNLIKKYPEKSIHIYSSDTSQSVKKEHFADVNTYWSQVDVLIYTPTVSAGVSFEQKHFHKIFGYFTDQSCPVETCIQMIGRIRDLSTKKLFICLQATGNSFPTTIDDIKSYVYEKRENLYKILNDTSLLGNIQIEYTIAGSRIVHHIGDYFQLWLENMRIKNLSKNSFIRRFLHILAQTGAKIALITESVFNEYTGMDFIMSDNTLNKEIEDIMTSHVAQRSENHSTECKKIADSKELTDLEVENILDDIIAQKDISKELKYAMEKHRLRVDYMYDGIIDEQFVSKYKNSKVRRIFKNLSRISSCEDVDIALKQIQTEERENNKYLMNMGEGFHGADLNRKYVFDQHRYALGLLKLCGWKNITDPRFIHKVTLAQNLHVGEKLLMGLLKSACKEFGIKAQINHDLICLIKPINKILTIMYGVYIISRKNLPDMYFLNCGNYFTNNPVESETKHIPFIRKGKN